MRNILFSCIIIFSISACSEDFFEQTIDIDPPEYEKQIVAHTLVSNLDSMFAVSLTRNFGILDATPDSAWTVRNAIVEIYEEGQLKLTAPYETYNDPWYRATLSPGFFQAGKSYEFRASHPDFPTISARQVMPGPFQIDSLAYREKAGIDDEGNELSAIDVYLKDEAGVKNYYVMELAGLYTGQLIPIYDSLGNVIGHDTTGIYVNYLYPESPEDPNVRLSLGNTLAVSDQFFDGQSYKFSFRSYRNNYSKYRAYVWSVTEDYFLYLLSAQRKYETDDLPLVEPVPVRDNMENGIGIFGLGWGEVREVK